MADLKPAYLIHGEDHGAIAERRARLRTIAEADGDATSVELLKGEAASPEGVALALSTMTLAIGAIRADGLGRRVIVVEGAERFKEAEVAEHIAPAMKAMPPDTTIAFFAREDARNKAPAALHRAVGDASGQIAVERAIKPWQLSGWVREQARGLGLCLDAHAAKALIAHVGERQQRLLRELEKLALQAERDGERQVTISAQEIERLAARSTAWRSFAFADALLAKDAAQAVRLYLRLRAQGERIAGLLYLMASRLREAESVSARMAAGESAAEVRRTLRMPSRAAERFIEDVGHTDVAQLRAALCRVADLELDTRGGAPLSAARTSLSSLADDTLALRAILAIAA